MQELSIRETISYSYNKVVSNWKPTLTLLALVIAFYAPFSLFGYVVDENGLNVALPWGIVLLVSLTSWVVQMHVDSTRIEYLMQLVTGKEPNPELFKKIDKKRIVEFIKGSVMYGCIVFAGFILLVIPGIIWAVKYSQWQYLVVNENLSARDALKKSGEITNGNKLVLMGLGIVLAFLSFLGIIPLFLGLILVVPMNWIAEIYVYLQLSKRFSHNKA